jgi:hypothetical protein
MVMTPDQVSHEHDGRNEEKQQSEVKLNKDTDTDTEIGKGKQEEMVDSCQAPTGELVPSALLVEIGRLANLDDATLCSAVVLLASASSSPSAFWSELCTSLS